MSSPLPSAAAPGIELIGVSKTFPTASGERVRAIDNVKAIAAIRDPPNRHDLTAKLLVDATQGYGLCAAPLPARSGKGSGRAAGRHA